MVTSGLVNTNLLRAERRLLDDQVAFLGVLRSDNPVRLRRRFPGNYVVRREWLVQRGRQVFGRVGHLEGVGIRPQCRVVPKRKPALLCLVGTRRNLHVFTQDNDTLPQAQRRSIRGRGL